MLLILKTTTIAVPHLTCVEGGRRSSGRSGGRRRRGPAVPPVVGPAELGGPWRRQGPRRRRGGQSRLGRCVDGCTIIVWLLTGRTAQCPRWGGGDDGTAAQRQLPLRGIAYHLYRSGGALRMLPLPSGHHQSSFPVDRACFVRIPLMRASPTTFLHCPDSKRSD